jgi:hypothetical protein
MIAFLVAQDFLLEGKKPSKVKLENLFRSAAPKMDMMRIHLNMDPTKYDNLEQWLMNEALEEMCMTGRFKAEFPDVQPSNVTKRWTYEEEIRIKGFPVPITKERIETVINTHGKCAVTILFEEHIIAGCFSAQVISIAQFNHNR